MPEQMREALENAGVDSRPENRREAMERAFDDIAATLPEAEGSDERPVQARRDGGRTDRTGAAEPVVKPAAKSGAEPLVKETPLKPLAKPAKGAPAAAAAGKQPVAKATGQEQPIGDAKPTKAPVSWSPAEREQWEGINPAAKAAILRREAEITRGLQESASARRFGGEFYNVIKPFEHLIRASGVTPLQAVDNLVKTAGGLQTGTAAQKAQIVANICAAYGVDLAMLDQVLAGRAPAPGANGNGAVPPDFTKALDERLKPIQDFISQVQGSRAASEAELAQQTATEAEAFIADPANEFFEDVRQDVADLLDLAAQRGRLMTLQQAYDIAVQQHPEIAKVVNERKEAASIAARAQNFDRSRRAASSQPAGNPGMVGGKSRSSGNQGESRREAIGRAWEDLSAG